MSSHTMFKPAVAAIQQKILFLRGRKVMLASDLAELYGVKTFRLNEAVKRNLKRFPNDFMFQLTSEEIEDLKSQFAISSWGGRRVLPYAFTEQGVAMLSGVLNSSRAIEVNIQIMRAFVQLRQMIQANKNLWKKIKEMESKYDEQFKAVFDALRELLEPPIKGKAKIGFHPS